MRLPVVGPFRQASSPPGLVVNYSPAVALFRMERDWLQGPNTIDQLKVEDNISRARPDELRWCVITNTSVKSLPLSSQRNRVRRRWVAAFRESLRKQGLRGDGKRDTSLVELPHTPEMAGTLELVVLEGYGLVEGPEVLRERTDKVVRALLQFGVGTRRVRFDDAGFMDREKWNGRR